MQYRFYVSMVLQNIYKVIIYSKETINHCLRHIFLRFRNKTTLHKMYFKQLMNFRLYFLSNITTFDIVQ